VADEKVRHPILHNAAAFPVIANMNVLGEEVYREAKGKLPPTGDSVIGRMSCVRSWQAGNGAEIGT
jgi:hypothetical protein